MTKFVVDPATVTAFANAGFSAEKQFEKEVEMIKAAAVKGVLPPGYSLAYRAGVVCAKAGLRNTVANRAKVATTKGRKEHKAFWAAAGNRLKLRVAEAGITNGNKAGRKRGSKVVSTGTPAQTAPAAAQSVKGPALQKGKKVEAEARQASWQGVSVPTLGAAAELDQHLQGLVAFARATATANPGAVDDVNRTALMAVTAAIETMNRARIDSDHAE